MKINPVSFGETSIGSDLTLTVADTILQTSTTADAHRIARSQYPAEQASTVEFYFYSPNAVAPSLLPVSGVPPLSLGFCLSTADLNKYLGEDGNGTGWCPGDGTVRNNGAVIATWATAPLGSFLSMTIDPVLQKASFAVNGTVIGELDTPAGFIYFAATVSGDPGDMAVWANGGQTPLKYETGTSGWSRFAIGLTPMYLATEEYISSPTDTPPNQQFFGDIDRSQSPMVISRGIDVWTWGDSKPQEMGGSTQIEIDILDPENRYGEFMTLDIRDELVVIDRGAQGDALANFEDVFTAVIDHCEQPTDQRKTLYATGKKSLLESQLVRPVFPPDADQSVQGKQRPMRFGIDRNYTPPFFDGTNRDLAVTDIEPIAAYGKIRIGGVEKALGIDLVTDANGIDATLTADATGTVLLETTTFGGSYSTSSADLLNGDGEFDTGGNAGGGQTAMSGTSITVGTGPKGFAVGTGKPFVATSGVTVTSSTSGASMTGTVSSYLGGTLTVAVTSVTGAGTHNDWVITEGVNQPTNWIGGGGYPTDPANVIFQHVAGSPGYVRQEQKASAVYWLKHKTLVVQPGQTIAYEMKVRTAPYTGPAQIDGNPITIGPAYVYFSGMASPNFQFWPWTKFAVAAPGIYRGSFTNTQANALPLVIGNQCNNLVEGTAGVFSYLDIEYVHVVPLPSLTQNVSLDGPGLDDTLRALMIKRGALTDADYDPTGAVAIDQATGYMYGIGVSEKETPQVADCVKRILDSCCADLYETRDGRIGVARLIDPNTVADEDLEFDLHVSDFEDDIRIVPDRAEGLSTRLAGAPNGNPQSTSDFSNSSFGDVPQPVRSMLEQDFQWTVTGGVPLANRYWLAAQNADPLPSQLDRQEHGQAEITRVNTMYADPKNFFVDTVKTPLGRLLEVGQIGRLTDDTQIQNSDGEMEYLNEVLSTGKKTEIVWMQEQPSEGTTVVVFWG